jgi:hypothetical protein
VGFERRLLPMASAYWDLQDGGGVAAPAPRRHRGAAPTFVAWLAGVPLVAAGLFVNQAAVLASGAWLLFAGSLLMSINLFLVLSPRQRQRAGVLQGRPAL